MNNTIIRYSGSKINFMNDINTFINKTDKKIYIEPFFGSGAVFLNLEKEFDRYYINDIEPSIILIFNSIKKTNYNDFIEYVNHVHSKFGDIKRNKESYYNFRNKFNEKLYNTDTIFEGFGYILLYNSCINSMARFGPNGFNQSYGNRLFIPSENEWNNAKKRLEKTELSNLDFFEFLNNLNESESDCLYFLDPPYIKREIGYKTISNDFYINYIKWINNTKANILYTDIDHNDLNLNKYELRTMRNISPNRKSEYTDKEVMFYNF